MNDSYKTKEKLWLVILAMVVIMFIMSGCSSTPKVQAQMPQYCHTSQTILTKNGERVESATLVECTDDQIKRVTASRAGFSPYCGEFTYWMRIGGQDVQRKGVSCQKPDGSWEIVNVVGR